jgi:hypothetical protein
LFSLIYQCSKYFVISIIITLLLFLFIHNVYMRIQEEMVKMLNEESLDAIRLNYPNSSSIATLKHFFVVFKKAC